MAYWRFSVPPGLLTDDHREAIKEIPGVKINRATIAIPENGAFVIEELLSSRGLPFTVGKPAPRPRKDARLALPWLREWVPKFLTSYQREGILAALNMENASGHLWWSGGAGKTLGAIVWALAFGTQTTIVVTKAAIRNTWAREIETYCQGVIWRILEGVKVSEVEGLDSKRPTILVTGYDTLPSWIDKIEKLRPRCVIFDEVQYAKSWRRWSAALDTRLGQDGPELVPDDYEPKVTFSLKENQTAACYRLSRIAHHRLATTATPISDRVRDLWAQLDLVHPWEWGSFYVWARRYAGAIENPYGGIDTRGKSNLEELRKRVEFVRHRVPFSVANRELPPKRRLVTYVKVKDQARPLAIAAEIKAAMRGVKSGAEGRARLLEVRLMESASRKRPIVVAHTVDAVAAKLKVVIFTGRVKDSERLEKDIRTAVGEGVPIWQGTGATPIGDPISPAEGTRYGMLDAYMKSPGPAVLIGTGEAWGTGLNIQDTDLAIMAMLPYTPRQIIQREARFARLGQKRPVLIRYLLCEGTVDEHVAAILLNKLPAVEQATQSDEIHGLGRELVGASEEELLNSMLEKVLADPEGTGT